MAIIAGGIHFRRYMMQYKKGRHGEFKIVFTPLLQTGTADPTQAITFTGATPTDAYSKAFRAGFRDADSERVQMKEPNRWQERWPTKG